MVKKSLVALTMAASVLGSGLGAPAAVAADDVTPPSVPQNVHISGFDHGQPIMSWDASTDDSGSVDHYWVRVDGRQRARPRATTYSIYTLFLLDRITKGPHTITIEAVDPSHNRSAPSEGVDIVVV
jgi:hypothetical protein